MLQSQTVTRATLELLKELMRLPELKQFALVGGTNLSLRLGHRLSIDLDLFTNEYFDTELIFNKLQVIYPNIILASQSETMLFLYIDDVKIDMVLLPYPYIRPIEVIDEIRLVSVEDIVAMKLSAVARRGVKKDFWDVAALLDIFKVDEMIHFYKEKYTSRDIFHLLRSLVYFQDAESQKDPEPLIKMSWKQVKNKIEKNVNNYLKNNHLL